jgi:hypothetical protein
LIWRVVKLETVSKYYTMLLVSTKYNHSSSVQGYERYKSWVKRNWKLIICFGRRMMFRERTNTSLRWGPLTIENDPIVKWVSVSVSFKEFECWMSVRGSVNTFANWERYSELVFDLESNTKQLSIIFTNENHQRKKLSTYWEETEQSLVLIELNWEEKWQQDRLTKPNMHHTNMFRKSLTNWLFQERVFREHRVHKFHPRENISKR